MKMENIKDIQIGLTWIKLGRQVGISPHDTLSKVYENPTGADHKSKKYQEDNLSSGFEDVLTKTAKTWRISRKSRWRKTNEKDGFRLFRNRNFS